MVLRGNRTASINGDNMLVAVRMRPLSMKELQSGQRSCCEVMGDKIVAITKAKKPGAVLKSEMGSVNEYQFDEAFDANVPQYEVYQRTAKRLIPSVLEGFNVTVFAYGATGAGKTHTMMGSERMDAGEFCNIGHFTDSFGECGGEGWIVVVEWMDGGEIGYDMMGLRGLAEYRGSD